MALQRLRDKGLSADKIDEYRAAFDLFDVDRSGKLTADKLGAVLNDKFGQSFQYDDLAYMLRQFDDSGEVTFESFAWSLHQKMGDPRFGDAFGDAFDLFDQVGVNPVFCAICFSVL
jgi:calmodulin